MGMFAGHVSLPHEKEDSDSVATYIGKYRLPKSSNCLCESRLASELRQKSNDDLHGKELDSTTVMLVC